MTLPVASDDYAAPNGMVLSKAAWDAALTDIGARLRAAEAVRANFDALIASGTGDALAVIEANVGPTLAALEASIATAQAEMTTALGQIATLLAGSIAADHVNFTPAGTISSTTAQAAITEVATDAAAALVAAVAAMMTHPVSANTSLVSGYAYRIVGGSSITLTLPASPASGDTIRVTDGEIVSLSNRPTIARNGHTIMGSASDLTIDAVGADFLIWWSGTDWRLF